jgi:hypothetical protein
MLRIAAVAVTLFFALPIPVQPAKVFVWTDENGVKHFSNMGPSETTEDFRQEREWPGASPPVHRPPGSRSATPQQKVATSNEDPPVDRAAAPSDATPTDPDADYIETTRLDLVVFPIPQDNLVRREKSMVGALLQELEQPEADRQRLLDREERRLARAIRDLDEAPLEKFGSQKNKRRQVGYYKYRLEILQTDPAEYLKYPRSDVD